MERDYSYLGSCLDDDRAPDEEDEYGQYYCNYNSDELCYTCFDRACYCEFSLKFERELDVEAIPPISNPTDINCSSCNFPIAALDFLIFIKSVKI